MNESALATETTPGISGAPSADEITALCETLCRAWENGSGVEFAAGFTAHAHFVAFDGTVLRGPEAIAQFHQFAFDTHLQGTRLNVKIAETRTLGNFAAVIFASGYIERDGASHGDLIGPSVQTAVVVRCETGQVLIDAFQNTRARPIEGPNSAEVWKTFDRLWNELAGQPKFLAPRV